MSKVMISLPDAFLKALDVAARVENRTRSELIREAVRSYLKEDQHYKRPIDNPVVREAYEYIIGHPIPWSGESDSSAVIREMRETRHSASPSE